LNEIYQDVDAYWESKLPSFAFAVANSAPMTFSHSIVVSVDDPAVFTRQVIADQSAGILRFDFGQLAHSDVNVLNDLLRSGQRRLKC
jgi:hypothetical protein